MVKQISKIFICLKIVQEVIMNLKLSESNSKTKFKSVDVLKFGKFGLYYNLIILTMREVFSDELNSSNSYYQPTYHRQQTKQARRIRIQKNKAIRKHRLNLKNKESYQTNTVQSCFENKAEVQKFKNRQAAQKSRQSKKLYVQSLQAQVKMLTAQLHGPFYCNRCRCEISNPNTTQEESFSNIIHQPEQESQFVRINNDSSHSSIGMYLFIAMITISVLCFGVVYQTEQQTAIMTRELSSFAAYTPPMDPYLIESNTNQNNRVRDIQNIQLFSKKNIETIYEPNKNENGVLPFSYLNKRFNNGVCLKDIIQSSATYAEKQQNEVYHLRAHGQNKETNLLFCQLPKIYRGNNSLRNIFTNVIDIMVSGKELMEVIEVPEGYEQKQILDLDSIYQIKVEVKEIIKIQTFPSCLN